jgi:hypothetical protein
MSELIVDKDRGLTALDLLSTTYKKAAVVAKKSSKAALSLILVFFAFLGFNSMPTDSGVPNIFVDEVISSNTSDETKEVFENEVKIEEKNAVAVGVDEPELVADKEFLPVENARAKALSFAGLDQKGIPTGFTVTDSTGSLGSLYITNRTPILSETELTISQVAKTDSGAANIFISQQLISGAKGFEYAPTLSFGRAGNWIPLLTSLSYLNSERLLSGDYLITAIIKVESEVETSVVIPASAMGRDLARAPRQVITRLVLNPGKTQILAQAVYVVEKGVK